MSDAPRGLLPWLVAIGTIASTAVFAGLKPTDGSAVSQHRTDLSEAA